MGLETKRAIKEVIEKALPEYASMITEAAGKDIPFEFNWESFGNNAENIRRVEKMFLRIIADALKEICSDELGKEAVNESIHQISLTNVEEKDQIDISLSEGCVQVKIAFELEFGGDFTVNEFNSQITAAL